MAHEDQAEQINDDATEVETEVEQGTVEGETPDTDSADEGEVVISIAGESPPADEDEEPPEVRIPELRKAYRDLKRENRELRQKLAPVEKADQVEEVGPEPEMDDEDVDYDKDAFKRKWSAWTARKQAADARRQAAQDAEKKAQEQWQATLDTHAKHKAALKVPDYDDAEAAAAELLSVTQRGIIVTGADNSAAVLYALGKNPAKAKELAAITDPSKFAFAVGKLESKLTITPRKAAPPAPERTVAGSASVSGAVDSKLAALEAEADKTGDRSKILAYRKQLRSAA